MQKREKFLPFSIKKKLLGLMVSHWLAGLYRLELTVVSIATRAENQVYNSLGTLSQF